MRPAVGVINVERMYPTVLGANIGTCVTGVLAALAASASKLHLTLQVAYVHLFFNISGIFVFYGIWPLRWLPINAAKFLGRTTAHYRWFAPTYLFCMFLLFPLIFVGLAFAGAAAVITVVVLLCLFFGFIIIVNVLQTRKPQWLPEKLRDWEWVPLWMRSLAPMDRVICKPLGDKLVIVCPCCKSKGGPSSRSKVLAKVDAAPDVENGTVTA